MPDIKIPNNSICLTGHLSTQRGSLRSTLPIHLTHIRTSQSYPWSRISLSPYTHESIMLTTNIKSKCADYPRVTVGPENPIRVERDETAELYCEVPILNIIPITACFYQLRQELQWLSWSIRDPAAAAATFSDFSNSSDSKVKVKVKGPNMCYIFEKHGIQGYRI